MRPLTANSLCEIAHSPSKAARAVNRAAPSLVLGKASYGPLDRSDKAVCFFVAIKEEVIWCVVLADKPQNRYAW
jgi:hypothetical protein